MKKRYPMEGGTEMSSRKKKRTAGDVILTLVLIIAIAVFCFAAYKLVTIFMEYKAGTDEYNEIAEMAVTPNTTDETDKTEKEKDLVDLEPTENTIQAPITVDFDALRAVNEDVIGWLYVEALSDTINYPIVHGKDNEEYLHMTYQRNYNFAGTIFIDCENSTDFNDCNTLVYGHNMKNGSMFGQLKKFVRDENTYKDSKYFWILTPKKNYRYEIIAAYTTGVNSSTYTLFSAPGEEFEEYLKTILSRSEIETNDEPMTQDDRIVTLSTCTGDSSTRFVVQGKRVDAVDVVK
jgi:sortase B